MNRLGILRTSCRAGARNWRTSRQQCRFESTKGQAPKDESIDIPNPLWYQKLGPVSTFFRWFHRAQQKRPLTVQVATSVFTYFVGDLVAQDLGGEIYDGNRTLRMVTIGACATIPGYKWFMFLGRNFNYTSIWRSIATKVVVQQAVFTPVFNSYFFGMQALLTGEPPSGVIRRIQQTVPTSIMNSLKLWPAVTAFSFAFVLPQYRMMFSGFFAVFWQAYLSILNRKAETGKIEVQAPTVLEVASA